MNFKNDYKKKYQQTNNIKRTNKLQKYLLLANLNDIIFDVSKIIKKKN
jgi:hypothetical protein